MRKWILLLLAGCFLMACTPGLRAPVTATPPPITVAPSPTPVPTPRPLLGPREGWWNDAVFYQVFVRSFYDSSGDGFGDLQGLIAQLDYLNDGDPTTDHDLGITALWLLPVKASPSYHGYDVVDYYSVNPDYGRAEDFKALIEAAHERGIRVIIDLVLNHSSSAHPWFIESAQNPESARRDWYVWSEETPPLYQGPWGQQVWYRRGAAWYYAVFWSEMPDLNLTNASVTEELYDVAEYWLEEMGADGFRLDAVRYLVEDDLMTATPRLATTEQTVSWLADFREHYVSVSSEAMTVGEVWSHTQEVNRYLESGALDLAFEFDLAEAIIGAVVSGSPAALRSQLALVTTTYDPPHYATFLTNHDQDRVMGRLRGDLDRMKLASSIYLTLPGVPFIYYGEEIGMVGYKPDELIRTPMQWSDAPHAGFTNGLPWQPVNADYEGVNVADQLDDPDSLLSHYRNLIRLRQEHAALRSGSFTPVDSSDRILYGYLRHVEGNQVLVLLNFAAQERDEVILSLAASPLPPGTYSVTDALSGLELSPLIVGEGGGFDSEPLPPLSARRAFIFVLAD